MFCKIINPIIFVISIFFSVNVFASQDFYDYADKILNAEDFNERSALIDHQMEEIKNNYLDNNNYIEHNKKSIDYIYKLMTLMEYLSKNKNVDFYTDLIKEISIKNNNYGMEYYYKVQIDFKEDNKKNKELLESLYKSAIKSAVINKNDDLMFELYNSLVWHFIYADDYAMAMKNIVNIEKYVDKPLNKIRFFELKYIYYYNLSNFEEALKMVEQQHDIMKTEDVNYKTIENKNNIVITLNFHYSIVLSKLKRYDEAIVYANKLKSYTENIKDPYIEVQSYTALIYAKLNKGDISGAKEGLDKIKHILDTRDVKNKIFLIVNQKSIMSLYYKKVGDNDKLLKYLIEFEEFLKVEDPYGLPEIIGKLSEAYMLNNLYKEAVDYKRVEIENLENKLNDKIISISIVINEEIDNNIFEKEKSIISEKIKEQDVKIKQNKEKSELYTNKFYVNMFFLTLLTFLMCVLFTLYRKTKDLLYIDHLTNIKNRRYIKERVDRKLKWKKSINLILFDLDFFKKINDTYGHDVGDKVLTKISSEVSLVVNKKDIFARIGGEEFLVLVNSEDPYLLAEKIRVCVENVDFSDFDFDFDLKVTSSFGVSSWVDEDSFEKILEKADEKLYKAKNNGRNQVF